MPEQVNEPQTIQPSATLTGGTFTISQSVTVYPKWYVRLWRWLCRRDTFDIIEIQTSPITYDATATEVQTEIERVFPGLAGNVIIQSPQANNNEAMEAARRLMDSHNELFKNIAQYEKEHPDA